LQSLLIPLLLSLIHFNHY